LPTPLPPPTPPPSLHDALPIFSSRISRVSIYRFKDAVRGRHAMSPAACPQLHLESSGMSSSETSQNLPIQPSPENSAGRAAGIADRKSTRLNSSHQIISYAVFC